MKLATLLLVLFTAFATTVFATTVNPGNPYLRSPITHAINLNAAVNAAGVGNDAFTSGSTFQRVARFTYSTAGAGSSVGVHSTGVWLPAKAVITRDYFRVDSAFTHTGVGTIQLSCFTAGNIKPAIDYAAFSAASTFQDGSTTGAIGTFVGASTGDVITSACEITATVGTSISSTGKLTGWIEYIGRD